MTSLGHLCLLSALVGSGYAAFACIAGARRDHRFMVRSGLWAAFLAVFSLTAATGLLAWALLTKDFHFQYVTQYSDPLLPWHYSLSAFWVGQAGSLLLWAWFVAVLTLAYRLGVRGQRNELCDYAFGVLMASLCLLVTIMVFAADPMQPSLVARNSGAGLAPLLQHPAMLAHPPIVFLGYAAWGIPFALAVAALASGRLDDAWVRQARPWALFAWTVLGCGILIGAYWAYEELGWGGYWNWDPIENGSLMPWLTGTALIHCLMTWQYRGLFKKAALLLAVATFGLCNFATFLTRSGIFSSLHAFSQSTIGWTFLAWMLAITVGGIALIAWRRSALRAQMPIGSLSSRESLVLMATVALVLLAAVVLLGTLTGPLSGILSSSKIVVGAALYNRALIPIGLVLLAVLAVAPLLRWGDSPTRSQSKALACAAGVGAIAVAAALVYGLRHFVALAVTGLVVFALFAVAGALAVDLRARPSLRLWPRLVSVLSDHRRQYAGFLIHLGFGCLAIGVAGSSLGSREHQAVMAKGDTVEWIGRQIRYLGLIERDMPADAYVAEAELEVSESGASPFSLLPARHLHRQQNEWTTEVAIRSTWSGDFYAIFEGGKGAGHGPRNIHREPHDAMALALRLDRHCRRRDRIVANGTASPTAAGDPVGPTIRGAPAPSSRRNRSPKINPGLTQ